MRGRAMQAALAALLDPVRGSRDALPHLAALERTLGERGASAIDRLAPHWRLRIASQLASLPQPEGDGALIDLQDRLLGKPPAAPARAARNTDFDPERTVVVRELSHSEFMAIAGAQAGGGDQPR